MDFSNSSDIYGVASPKSELSYPTSFQPMSSTVNKTRCGLDIFSSSDDDDDDNDDDSDSDDEEEKDEEEEAEEAEVAAVAATATTAPMASTTPATARARFRPLEGGDSGTTCCSPPCAGRRLVVSLTPASMSYGLVPCSH